MTRPDVIDSLVTDLYNQLVFNCTSPKDAVIVLLAIHVKITTGNIDVPLDIMLQKYCDAFREIYQKN